MWDAEDRECSSSWESNVEAICAQFARDPRKCDRHQNCFWDRVDRECEEAIVPMGMLPSHFSFNAKPCASNLDVHGCAGQPECFWDSTAGRGVCVNVVQASNVCHVLNSPQECSTNRICQWQGLQCVASAGLQRLHAVHKIDRKTQHSSTWEKKAFAATAACACGILVGFFTFWARSKCLHTSNDDYRDIILDQQRLV